MASPLIFYPKQCISCHQWIFQQRFCPVSGSDLLAATEKEVLKLELGLVHVTCPNTTLLPPIQSFKSQTPLQDLTTKQRLEEAGQIIMSKGSDMEKRAASSIILSKTFSLNSSTAIPKVLPHQTVRSSSPAVLLPESYLSRFQVTNQAVTTQHKSQQSQYSSSSSSANDTNPSSNEELDYKKLAANHTLEELVTLPNASLDQYMKTGLTWKVMQTLLSNPHNAPDQNYYVLRLFVDRLGLNYSHIFTFFNLSPTRDQSSLASLIVKGEITFSKREWSLLGVTVQTAFLIGLNYVQWMSLREK